MSLDCALDIALNVRIPWLIANLTTTCKAQDYLLGLLNGATVFRMESKVLCQQTNFCTYYFDERF